MMNENYNKEQLSDFLEQDYINRNQQLNILMDLLNNLEEAAVLSIDGEWGSGKTVFAKQLEMLNQKSDSGYKNIAESTRQEFKNKYSVVYLNAWENDHISDPLDVIIYNLLSNVKRYNPKKVEDYVRSVFGVVDISQAISTNTGGLINLKSLSAKGKEGKIIDYIESILDKNDLVDNLISKYKSDFKDKKLLFIIDELDRCKPDFAIKFLETIKHYFYTEDTVFILSTNIEQLENIVKSYYGSNFDSGRYLEKFFDASINLREVDIDGYYNRLYEVGGSSYYRISMPKKIAKAFGLSMREINKNTKTLSLIGPFLDKEKFFEDELEFAFTHYILLPIAIILKNRSTKEFKQFLDGQSFKIIENKINQNNEFKKEIRHVLFGPEKTNSSLIINKSKALYNKILTSEDDHNTNELRSNLKEAVNLIGSFTDTEPNSGEKNE